MEFSATIPAMKLRIGFFVLGCSLMVTAQALAPDEVEITSEPSHHLALQNSYVRVFKVEVAPHASTMMHWHRHDYAFVTLGASEVENDVKDKAPATLQLRDGEAHFSAGPFAHVAKNLAATPFRNVTVELLKDEEAKRTAPAAWDPERGLSVLHGGTIDILFVKDGARVSEVELQPGGVVPEHPHTGPQLMVAVTDLELQSQAKGKSPTHLELKSGDIKWVEDGIPHTVTNVGKQPAKVVTMEFH